MYFHKRLVSTFRNDVPFPEKVNETHLNVLNQSCAVIRTRAGMPAHVTSSEKLALLCTAFKRFICKDS